MMACNVSAWINVQAGLLISDRSAKVATVPVSLVKVKYFKEFLSSTLEFLFMNTSYWINSLGAARDCTSCNNEDALFSKICYPECPPGSRKIVALGGGYTCEPCIASCSKCDGNFHLSHTSFVLTF